VCVLNETVVRRKQKAKVYLEKRDKKKIAQQLCFGAACSLSITGPVFNKHN